MKAVLGLLLILVGFTVGWLVITGKLPPANAPLTVPGVVGAGAQQQQPSPKPTPPLQQLGGTKQSGTAKQ